MSVIILQSAAIVRPEWVDDCLSSVVDWCKRAGYRHHFLDDTLFDCVPNWYLEKIDGRLPIASDYARLWHCRQLLKAGAEQVLWLDADTLITDPEWRLPNTSHTLFGEECWVQCDERGRLQIKRQPHNAFSAFRHDSPVLDFLLEATQSIIARADPQFIAPQMVGPKLLKALHNIVHFDLVPAAGALSPEVIQAITDGGGAALALFLDERRCNTAMVNLCASLQRHPDGEEALPLARIKSLIGAESITNS